MGIEVVFEGLWVLLLLIYYQLESLVRLFIKPRRKNVEGQIVLVTGAGSGIGQRLAAEFAKLGAIVVGCDISEEGLNATRKVLHDEARASFHSYTCDLSQREAIYEMADKIKKDVGKVNILINNAGIVTGKKIMDCPDVLMQKTMQVNVIAHFWTLKAFLPDMMSANHGHVVTIASGAGFFGVPGQIDYAASKFGAVGLTEALFQELDHVGKSGVKVTCVCPYYINTGMFDGVKVGLMPMLEKQETVLKIVDAILRNQYLLMMPKVTYVFAALKNILPTKCLRVMSKFTGVNATMDEFVGRKKTS